jgi:G8 domain-containing protein
MKTTPCLKRSSAVFALASMLALAANAPAVVAATVTSVATGLWNVPATWDTGVPAPTDDVVIGAGTTVDINTTPLAMNSLTVNGTLEYDATLRAVTVTTNVYIAPGGILQTNPTGAQTGHTLSVGGNLTNDGTLELSTSGNTSGARLTFTGATNNTLGGIGATTDLRTLTINKGTSKANLLEITTAALSVQGTVVDGTPMAFLTITNGTLKISGTFTFAGRTFTAAGYSIPANGGFWLNNPNYTVSAQAGSPSLGGSGAAGTGTPGAGGLLRVSAGTLNIGTAANNSIGFGNNSVVTVEGGAINVAGRWGVNNAANNLTYSQTGGAITLCTIGNTSTTLASFDLGQGLGPDVVMSGGTVTVRINATGIGPFRDYRNQQGSTALGITGTVLQFGDAGSGAAKTFRVEGLLPHVVVNNASAGHTVLFSPATFFDNSANNVTINPGCTLDIGNQVYLERGNTVTNDGTLGANGPSSRFVWFAGGNGTYQGAGVTTGVLSSWETQAANLTMSQLSQVTARRIILFAGNILNASKLTLGDASATLNVVQLGNTTTPTAAGAFDVAPTFNLGTGGEHLAYMRTTASRSTGVEVEPGRAPVNLTYDDNDGSHALTIAGGDLTVSGTTALTNGRVITNANTLIANGGVMRATGYVDGLLQKPVTVGGPVARTFEVGDAVAYSPINVTFASVTGAGALTGMATGGDHPQIGSSDIIPSKSVNRYWTLTNSGTTFTTADAVFNFVAGDIDGGANFNAFFVRKYDAPNWSAPTTGARTATSAQATGITSFSDFAIGEPPTQTILASAGTGGSISPSGSVIVLDGGDQAFTITPDGGYVIADVVVDGVSQGPVPGYTFTAVHAGHTINATFDTPTPTVVIQFQADPVGEALALRWELSRTVAVASVALERAENPVGPWKKVDAEPTQVGTATVVTDRSVVGGHTYWYRLVTVTTSGDQATFGPLEATAVRDVKEFSLGTVSPNPTRGSLGINFAVAKPTHVHLSLLDVQGRVVEVFADGEYGVGRYQAQFDGQGRGGRIPAGVYFVHYVANRQTFTRRVVFTP